MQQFLLCKEDGHKLCAKGAEAALLASVYKFHSYLYVFMLLIDFEPVRTMAVSPAQRSDAQCRRLLYNIQDH